MKVGDHTKPDFLRAGSAVSARGRASFVPAGVNSSSLDSVLGGDKPVIGRRRVAG